MSTSRYLREYRRLDYNILHTTGERVFKEEKKMSESEKSNGEDNLLVQEEALSDDILDFLDENTVKEINELTKELEMAIEKMEGTLTVFISYKAQRTSSCDGRKI